MVGKSWQLLCLIVLFAAACAHKKELSLKHLFTLLPSSLTKVTFANNISYTEEFNPYTFRNFFNGGGVAIGDINNDGLPDIFFCSNQQTNRLYLNKGNFKFEDITDQAGVKSDGIWSTGVTMADVNGDGWLDIYVCKSGDLKGKNRSNELFINNGSAPLTRAFLPLLKKIIASFSKGEGAQRADEVESRAEVTFTEKSKRIWFR
ncbi:MAG: VCBS repeat-containing protein [Segetibacter sp.]